MSTTPTTLRPSSYGAMVGWVGVGGTLNTVVSDNNDATYMHDNATGSPNSGHAVYFLFNKPTIPANAALQKIVPRVRWTRTTQQDNTIRTQVQSQYPVLNGYKGPVAYNQTTYNVYTTVSLPGAPSVLPGDSPTVDKALTNLSLEIRSWGIADNPGQARVAEVYLDVYFNEQPVPSALTVSSLSTSSVPSFSWTFTDPENDDQAGFRAAVWLAADAADANCPQIGRSFVATDGTTRTALAATGSGSNLDQLTSGAQWNPGVSLPNSALVAYVQVADQIGDRIRWSTVIASKSFTMAVPAPTAPSLTTIAWDDSNVGYAITASAPAYSHSPATTQTLYIERQVGSTSAPWDLLPAPAFTGLAGGSVQTVTVVDPLVRSNSQVRYRAYTVHFDGTNSFQSPRSTISAFRSHTFTAFYVRNPLDPGNTVLRTQVTDALAFSSDEQLGVFWPATSPGSGPVSPSFVSQGVQRPSVPFPIVLRSEADFQTFQKLRNMQTVLLVQTDMDGIAYWGRLAATIPWQLLNSTDRRNALKRPYTVAAQLWLCAPAVRADGSQIGDA